VAVKILQPGLLSLLQDGGRYGQHRIGLTNGGPLDPGASQLCNRLLGNAADATVIEVSFGGLQLEVLDDTFICVTGARMPMQINGKDVARYEVHPVTAGDRVTLDFAESGCRAYLGVADGFEVAASFGSTATVVREHIGGLDGEKLSDGDILACPDVKQRRLFFINP